jgi:glycosyltransferase involved in cell wall biosynthesis
MTTRVALITPPLDASGGIGRLMSYVVKTLPADDVAITLLDPRGHSTNPVLSIFPLVRTWLKLLALGLGRRIDVAHINLSSHGSSIRKPVLLWTCKLLRVPVVLHLHASEYPEFFEALPRPAKAILRRTFSGATLVVVLGNRWRDYVQRELGVPAERVQVLLNAAPAPQRNAGSRARRSEPRHILFLGRLGARKGVPELLEALASPRVRSRSWVATFAGDGDVEFYRAQASHLGIDDRARFSGWLDTPAALELLQTSDLLVLPSHAEGLPMSIVEAFACGVPVVCTPVGAIPDVVEDRVNGLLVEPGSSTQLADALVKLLEDDRLRSTLAENAQRTWERSLDIAAYAHELSARWREASLRRQQVVRP